MKFKKIMPGMAIHCKTESDARTLLKHLKELGYNVQDMHPELEWRQEIGEGIFYLIENNTFWSWSKNMRPFFPYAIVEFSNLIDPDLKFHVGDKVKIKNKLEAGMTYGSTYITEEMSKASGQEATIGGACVLDKTYFLREFGDVWPEELLEPSFNTSNVLNDGFNAQMSGTEDLVSRKELYRQIGLYLNKSSLGETTAYTELNIGEIASIIKGCPSANAEEKYGEMSAVKVLKWLAKADKETLHIVFDCDNIIDLLEDVSADQIVKGISTYEAAKIR